MFFKYIYTAWQEIKQHPSRNLLATVEIILAVACVILFFGITAGIQQQIEKNYNFSQRIITLHSGQSVVRDVEGQITEYNIAHSIGAEPNLTKADWQVLREHPEIEVTAPIVNLHAPISNAEGTLMGNSHVIGTDENLISVLGQSLAYGNNALDSHARTAIIGNEVARELFNNSQPIAHEIKIANQTFIVTGVLESIDQLNLFNLDVNYNRSVLISLEAVNGLKSQPAEDISMSKILALSYQLPSDQALQDIDEEILINHNQRDFSLYRNSELLPLLDSILQFLKTLAIVLVIVFLGVGGFSLMIALQSSLRQRRIEINVRKIVGATNFQILYQIIIEATVLSVLGGFLGIILGIMISIFISYLSPVEIVLHLDSLAYVIISMPVLGLIFGLYPALQASSQNPDQRIYE
ncbi:MAG: ABC transporter permease [Candidatus Saccharibacteria bacterium]|nr:ABC transporter permease [Candidatus Saccharibacteria bacterium]